MVKTLDGQIVLTKSCSPHGPQHDKWLIRIYGPESRVLVDVVMPLSDFAQALGQRVTNCKVEYDTEAVK
jgi:hypothetical protein